MVGAGVPVEVAVAVGLGVFVSGGTVGVDVLAGRFLSAISVANVLGIGAVGRGDGVSEGLADVAVIAIDVGVISATSAATVGV